MILPFKPNLRRLSWLLCLIVMMAPNLILGAGPNVEIIIGKEAASLERMAAEELAAQLNRLYQAETTISSTVGKSSADRIFVGNPESNAYLQDFSKDWPKLSDQGHCLKSIRF